MAQSVLINGVVYSNVPSVSIPLSSGTGDVSFYDTSGDTATAPNILSGQKAHGSSGEITGTMHNNEAVSGSISTKDGTYTVPYGCHNGSGVVSISSDEQAKIISENIKSGVTVLGVSGSPSVIDTTISTNAATPSMLISGYKAYANGVLMTGEATVPSVSQDGTTKILTIS